MNTKTMLWIVAALIVGFFIAKKFPGIGMMRGGG